MRYVAVGDSFTEGVGDEPPAGAGGWADRLARGLAGGRGEAINYANLAIRGRTLPRIVSEQLPQALALRPTLLSLCGGGNDLLRPSFNLRQTEALLESVIISSLETSTHIVLVSPPDPSAHLPFGAFVHRRGNQLAEVMLRLAAKHSTGMVDISRDRELRRFEYWSADRIHLNSDGHRRVASLVLRASKFTAIEHALAWSAPTARSAISEWKYFRQHVAPWLKRRVLGRSSGDGRSPRHADWTMVAPEDAPNAGSPDN